MKRKWKFYKLPNLTVIAVLLKNVPMVCKDAVLHELLLKKHTINCLSFSVSKRPQENQITILRAFFVCLPSHAIQRMEEKTSKLFNLFINQMDGLSANQFHGVHMNDILFVEDLIPLSTLLYVIDIVHGNNIGELGRRNLKKYKNIFRRLRYKNHRCCVSNFNPVLQSFGCSNCDTFSTRTFNLERYLLTFSERLKIVYTRNVYHFRESFFDKLDSSGIKYTIEQELFKNSAIFDIESSCVQEEAFKGTNTKTWIVKHGPIYVSISSNPVEEYIFLCNSDPHHLVASFIGSLEGLALQNKTQMQLLFLDIETTIKVKLGTILAKLTQRPNRREQVSVDDCDNKRCVSTQSLQKKNQLIDLQEHLEQDCNLLPVFGFNSAKHDLNLIKSHLLPILVNDPC